MSVLRRITQLKSPARVFASNLQLTLAESAIQSNAEPHSSPIVSEICTAFRRGWNWDTLDRKFDYLVLNQSIVEGVLLQLKDPCDARFGLGFFHWSAKMKSFEHGVESYCMMIHILVGAEMIKDAKALLESILKKVAKISSSKLLVVDSLLSSYSITWSRPLVFDLLVQIYAKLRMFETAFDVSCYLEENGFSVNLTTFNTLLSVTEKSDGNHHLVWRIYEHMIHKRTFPNNATFKILTNALCKEGKLQKAVNLLDRIHGKRCSPPMIVNSHLIYRVLDEGKVGEAMALLKRMLQTNMVFDTIAASLTLYAKVKSEDVESAQKLFEEMIRRGLCANAFVYTTLIGAYCRDGRIEEADRLMREMEDAGLKPYDDTYNYLIEGWAKAGRVEQSLDYCTRTSSEGIVPSCSAFNQMVENLCETGDVKKANEMFTRLLDKGFSPDEVTYSLLISAYGRIGDGNEVLKLYYEMVYKEVPKGILVLESLIKSLCQCGKLSEAEKYARTMMLADGSQVETASVCEMLIRSYFEKGDTSGGLKFYNEMISKGLKLSIPNEAR